MSNKIVIKGGIGFPGLLFVVLLVCKLLGGNIEWLWVFSPLWIPLALGVSFFIISILIGLLIAWKRELL